MTNRVAHIVGAGPAGLVAAIALSRGGYQAIVHEQNADAGMRFNGDFQGIENWSENEDIPTFLRSIGIEMSFRCDPYVNTEFYGPSLQRVVLKTSRPLFYLVERGTNEWSIDQGLKQQALDAGVKILWNDKLERLPPGPVIVGTGPKAADAIAKGIIFSTSSPDTSVGIFDDRIAPKAYAYLLINRGRATFATCLFEDFKNERRYFARALKRMQEAVSFDISKPREFGAIVNFFLMPSAVKDGRILYVGENAGFQDALWGFGLKYAMRSGYLAARSIVEGRSYDRLCKEYIRPLMHVSLANRWMFALLGNRGYELLLARFSRASDATRVLQDSYAPSRLKTVLFRIAKQWYRARLVNKQCMHEHCDCVWCRHGEQMHRQSEGSASC
jgi:flavin-dependent dehydrogenase